MTSEETLALLRRAAAVYRITLDEVTLEVWQQALARYESGVCRAALDDYIRDSPYRSILPADIVTYIRKAHRYRVPNRQGCPQCDHGFIVARSPEGRLTSFDCACVPESMRLGAIWEPDKWPGYVVVKGGKG